MKLCPLAALVLLLAPVTSFAQTAEDDMATVVDLAGGKSLGRIQRLTDTTLTLVDETPRRHEVGEMLSLRFDKRQAVAPDRGPLVFLAQGDRLMLQPQTLDEEFLVGAWQSFPAWPPVKIPLEQVQAVAFQLPEYADDRRRLVADLLDRREKHDGVVFRNGDRLNGRLLALTTDSLSFEGPVGKLDVPRNDIRALTFNSELQSAPDSTGRRVLLELSDGTRLTTRRAVIEEQGLLDVETLFGAKMRVPASAVVSLRFLGGRAVYLSDLKAADYEFTPYLSTRWPLRLDRNVLGGSLRLRGREFAKGLGMHSQSAVTYDLDGKYSRFRATVGIDDSAGGKGNVRFAVEVDGERIFTSEPVTGADEPEEIGPLDVAGKQRLTLIVEFGELGDILDHADWCDAVLIR